MSAFIHIINVAATPSLAVPDEASLQAGAEPTVEVSVPAGLAVPIGPRQLGIILAGTYKFELERDQAIEFFRAGLEAAEKLPAKTKVETASSLSEVEAAAKRLQEITGQ